MKREHIRPIAGQIPAEFLRCIKRGVVKINEENEAAVEKMKFYQKTIAQIAPFHIG